MPAITIELSDEACEAIGRGIAGAIDIQGIANLVASQLTAAEASGSVDIETAAITAAEAVVQKIAENKTRKDQFSATETASLLGITNRALIQRRLRGTIKGVKVKGTKSYFYKREEIEKFTGELS